jgi:murein DD-endopeptidase MepM/ murein hydrolase activator NlpD
MITWPKKHKHRKLIQILVIPDDQAEPKAYGIPVRRLQFFKILGVVLALHTFFGLIAYIQYARIHHKNSELVRINKQLESSNKRIYDLASAFEDLESSQAKIRSALGLGSNSSHQIARSEAETIEPTVVPEAMSIYGNSSLREDIPSRKPVPEKLEERLGFLRQAKSGLDNYESSVPTFLPVEGVLTADFEETKTAGQAQHRGVDIAAPRGAFVRASADGIVVFADWTFDLGNLIILYHGNGFITYYGHNQSLLVTRNSLVKKGDPIALVGNSGQSSAPHLHFEIWRDGVPLDPKKYILAFSGM